LPFQSATTKSSPFVYVDIGENERSVQNIDVFFLLGR